MEIIRGQTAVAPKVLIYGQSGVGKSTLASKFKKPVFLDLEGGLNYLEVDRTPQIVSLDKFYKYLAELYQTAESGKRVYDTIVIDSTDWLVRKVVEKAAGIDKAHLEETLNKSNGGYGNGAQVLANHIRTKLLPMLVILNKQGYGICLIAHAERKTLVDEEGFNTDRIAPKIDEKTMHVFVEWADSVFYLKRGTDGERTLVLDGDDNILAKNRIGLTGEVKLSDIDINKLLMPQGKEKK